MNNETAPYTHIKRYLTYIYFGERLFLNLGGLFEGYGEKH